MKKLYKYSVLLIVLTAMLPKIVCMEGPPVTPAPTVPTAVTSLPAEVIEYILSFVSQGKSLKEIFDNLSKFAATHPQFRNIAKDPQVIRTVIRGYLGQLRSPVEIRNWLDRAAEKGNIDFVKLILDLWEHTKLDDQTKLRIFSKVFLTAIKNKHIEIAKLISNYKNGYIYKQIKPDILNQALAYAIKNGYNSLSKALLKSKRVNRNFVLQDYTENPNQETILMWAVRANLPEVVKLLLQPGPLGNRATVNAKAKDGNTALTIAADLKKSASNRAEALKYDEIAALLTDSSSNANIMHWLMHEKKQSYKKMGDKL